MSNTKTYVAKKFNAEEYIEEICRDFSWGPMNDINKTLFKSHLENLVRHVRVEERINILLKSDG